jgi:hypothetical protein
MQIDNGGVRPLGADGGQGGVNRIDFNDVVMAEAEEVGQRFPKAGFVLE